MHTLCNGQVIITFTNHKVQSVCTLLTHMGVYQHLTFKPLLNRSDQSFELTSAYCMIIHKLILLQ